MSKGNSSYNQILKSTTIFGGSQIIVILIGLIRTKIVALLLGPTGIGLIGIYQSIMDMIRSGSLLGMDTVGVKEVAAANSSEGITTLNKVVSSFNKWFYFSALLASIACVVFCYPISLWAFDSSEYAIYIALLSIASSLLIITTGRSVILQGMRKIPELAKSTILGSAIGLVITIPMYYIWKIDSIVPALIVSALISFLAVEYYYKKQNIRKAPVSNKESLRAGLSSLQLGIYIVIAGFIGTLSMFAIRAFISRNMDIDSAGLFQSAWVITNVYLALILKAMGADFFPRLSAISGEKEKVKKLVNEQTYIVLVIASPMIVGLLLFSDFALSVLYSSRFTSAEAILQWQTLGTFFKVLSWPMAFILLAKGKGKLFLFTELSFYLIYLLSAYLLYPYYGLDAAGIGYFVAYIIYIPMLYIIVKNLSRFEWSKEVWKMGIANLFMTICAFLTIAYLPDYTAIVGGFLLLSSLLYAYFNLKKVFDFEDLRKWFKKKE